LGFKFNYEFLAIYASSYSVPEKTKFLETLSNPRIFQWNYKNHIIAQDACYDIDGVLCKEPTEDQNDDGKKYIDFMLNAEPLYIPNYKIKALVTSRLEKYRSYTEKWLKENNVKYENLYMLDLPSKQERIRQNAHAKIKIEIYNKLNDCILFFESSVRQAKEIADKTKKPVICTENDVLY
jgi:uncharacterized HAD superfamily protein